MPSNKKSKPCGSWPSVISSDLIAAGSPGFDALQLAGGWLYWLEKRPTEGGRQVLMKQDLAAPAHPPQEVTPAPYNVRTRVHEYGGGGYLARQDCVYFCHDSDQQIYIAAPDGAVRQLTREKNLRFADMQLDTRRQRLICVCEDHSKSGQEPENLLVSIDIKTGAVTPLVRGHDFFAAPRISPDGRYLAWLSWDHPNMPWDGSDLWLAPLPPSYGEDLLDPAQHIAGGETESILQPLWSPQGILHYISDRSGWWNIERWHEDERQIVTQEPYEFGSPPWVFGLSSYGFNSASEIYCCYSEKGQSYLAHVLPGQKIEPVKTDYSQIASLRLDDAALYFIASSATQFNQVIRLNLAQSEHQVLARGGNIELARDAISAAQAISFVSANEQRAHAFFYPPVNPHYCGEANEKPPLIVKLHGGPTSSAAQGLDLHIQYWTSRGFALMDLNYRGSSGYGRDYRRLLYENWGITDVEDAIHGCRYLIEQGLVDRQRIVIRGGSAGGFTALSALVASDLFSAGASYYGVTDLEALVRDTHKFESRYLDRIVGPYPQERSRYVQRSPLHNADSLSCPVIFFQGLEDKIVPPSQTESMVQALEQKGIPVSYVTFADEQHGFRRAENIRVALDMELAFYLETWRRNKTGRGVLHAPLRT